MDNNKITTIPAGALSTMNQLYVLWLNYNELSSVPAEVLSRASLEVLRLGNNNLTSIPNSIGTSLSKLRYLGFRDNKVTTVPTSIAGLTKLQTLLISGNSINNFDPTVYNKSILVKEHWNQQYSETLASSRANQPYTFNGLPIYTQLTSYTPQPSITYSLIKPDLSEVVLPSVTISGGQITLPASLLGAAGNYTFKAVINNGDLFPSVYKQNFTLTGIKGVSQSGIPRVGDVLTATLDPTSLVINTTYQWEVSNNGIDGWTNISGATSNTYTIGAYAGKYIRVKASGNGVAGADGLVYSRPTEKIAALGKSVIESVLIQKSGDVLSIASTIPGDAINNITYQWQSSVNGVDKWTNIIGATSNSYTTSPLADFGMSFRLVITGTGTYDGTSTSNVEFIGVTFQDQFSDVTDEAVANSLSRTKTDPITRELINNTTFIFLANTSITNFAGISIFSNLEFLDVNNNLITAIPDDISDLTKLRESLLFNIIN